MTPVPHPSRRFGLVWLWTLVPLLVTLWLSWRYTPNFPHADHWGLESDLLVADAEGGVTWELLAHQKNDSRYVLSRLCYYLLAKATAWNVRVEAAFCVLLAGGLAVLAWWMARRTITGRAANAAGFLMALLILTPHQVMNWNFGVQICYFLPVASGLGAAAVFLSRMPLFKQTIAGIAIATLGSWSYASGWLVWGLVIWGVLGWSRRVHRASILQALGMTAAAIALNAAFYFDGYALQEGGDGLFHKLAAQGPAVLDYFLKVLGAGYAEGWPQTNSVDRGRFLLVLGPAMGIFLLLWLAGLALLHGRELLRRAGQTPAWMWTGLAGWSLLVVATVAVARTGITLSHPFASRYQAFAVWAWLAALALTLMLPAGRRKKILLTAGILVMGWGWAVGAVTGVRLMHREAYTLRMLQGTLTMAMVAPEPLGLRSNDPHMHTWLPVVERLDELGYIHPPLVRSPLVADARVLPDPAIEGEIQAFSGDSPWRVTGYAIDHRRGGPADSVVLSFQPEGGQEVWWTPITARTMEKSAKRVAREKGLKGEHSRIGWVWESGQDTTHYKPVTLPARPCIIRAYAMDGKTGTFHPLAGELSLIPPAPVEEAAAPPAAAPPAAAPAGGTSATPPAPEEPAPAGDPPPGGA